MRKNPRSRLGLLPFLLLIHGGLVSMFVPEKVTSQELPTEIAEDVFLLSGLGSNVVAVVNGESVLLIDNGRRNRVERLFQQVGILGSGSVEIAINTHFHFDHVGASEALGEAEATIIGHDNARSRMLGTWDPPDTLGVSYGPVPPYPETALPVLTFDHSFRVHFGNHEIVAVHFPDAHSDADIAVFIRDRNILHTGDLYLSNGLPIIDSWYGGSIDGLLSAIDGLVDLVDEETIVVPGHGPLSDRAGLRAYRDMLTAGRDRIAVLVSEGLTLEEVVEADPTAGLYPGGESWLDPKLFVWSVFMGMTGESR